MRLLALLATVATVSAQLLTKGNTQLPTCAQTCPALQQAVSACSGTGDVNLGTWSCFCQSAYLRTLYQSATGVCDSTCTNPTELQQVSTWYNTECGTDFGQTQHANSAGGNSQSSATSSAVNTATSGGAALPSTTSSGGFVASTNKAQSGTWWNNHWQWIVMLIALLIGLLAFGALLTWFKRRHERKRDIAPSGFNHGITNRPVPTIHTDHSFVQDSARASNAGRESVARTRGDATMPYGHGHTRTESRTGSQTNVSGQMFRRAPPSRIHTPVRDVEKGVAEDDAIRPIGQSDGASRTRQLHVPEQAMNEKR